MAPASAIPPPTIPNMPDAPGRAKRPVPTGIQTNGVDVSTPSPSPSAKRPPATAKQPQNSATPNIAPPTSTRPPSKPRREMSIQMAGRGSRNSAGLRSASIVAESAGPAAVEPRPYGTHPRTSDITDKSSLTAPQLLPRSIFSGNTRGTRRPSLFTCIQSISASINKTACSRTRPR